MKIPYKKLILVSLLPNVISQEQKPIQLVPPVSDFSVLATQWAKEYIPNEIYGELTLDWIDFDSTNQETKNFCERQDAKRRLKDCKLEIEQKGFSIEKVHEPSKGEYILFQQNYINNSSEPDQGSINEQFSYRDNYKIVTTKGMRKSSSTKIDAHASGDIWFAKWNIDASFKFDTQWDTSETKEQNHEENKRFAISERFNFPAYSKTEVAFLLQQANYNIEFNADIDVGGFFVFKTTYDSRSGYPSYYYQIFDPEDIVRTIQSSPEKYSEYLKELARPYIRKYENELGYSYGKLQYNATGKMSGVYGYKVDSKKSSTPLGNPFPTKTITETKTDTITTTEPITKSIPVTETFTQTVIPTNQANHLAVNKYSSAGLAFLTGLLLV